VVQAGPVDPQTYVLGPGDQLELNLWGRIDRMVTLDVRPEGKVFLQGRGAVMSAARRSPGRGTACSSRLPTNTSACTPTRAGPAAHVQGVSERCGEDARRVEATSATRCERADPAIGLADNASRRNIVLRHADSTTTRVDLDAFDRLGRLDLNPMLVDGDVIQVPAEREHATIAGAVPHWLDAETRPRRQHRDAGPARGRTHDLRDARAGVHGALPARHRA
jgi:hypothetical protein